MGVFLVATASAEQGDLGIAVKNVQESCGGIQVELARMKTMAGVNTAVTGIGTLAGGGAAVIGFVKLSKDNEAAGIEARLKKLKDFEYELEGLPDNNDEDRGEDQKADFWDKFDKYRTEVINEEKTRLEQLEKESKTLGNWRTGLMAGNTATNIAGAAIAGTNKVKNNIADQINDCKESVAALDSAAMQARIDGEDTHKAESIVKECWAWNHVDISKINARGNAAMVAAIVGAVAGGVGTATSAAANTKTVRAEGKEKEEKALNTASNVLAVGATGASAVATGFNAAQMSAINKALEVATACEGALIQ